VSETIRTDTDIIRIARKMDRLLRVVQSLTEDIYWSDHPNKEAIIARLNENYVPVMAWPTHCVHDALEHPEQWETGVFGIRHRQATKAVASRRQRTWQG